MTTTQTQFANFAWRMPPKVIPAFVQGEDAQRLYDSVREVVKSGLWYDASSQTMNGSHLFAVARIDTLVRPAGLRVATLADLSRPEIMEMVRGDHYSDTPALVLRTLTDSYAPNAELIRKLAPQIEEKAGKLELPLMVTGFDVVSADNQYGLDITPREDFAVLHDERLGEKYNGRRFNQTDELGLPKFEDNGKRTWYARSQGLSRLFLYGSLDLGSGNDYLAYSDGSGRVVLVRGEATAPDSKAK